MGIMALGWGGFFSIPLSAQEGWTPQGFAQRCTLWAKALEEAAADGQVTPWERGALLRSIPERFVLGGREVSLAGLRQGLTLLRSASEAQAWAATLRQWALWSLEEPPSLPADFEEQVKKVLADKRLERYRQPSLLQRWLERWVMRFTDWLARLFSTALPLGKGGAEWFAHFLLVAIALTLLFLAWYGGYALLRPRRKASVASPLASPSPGEPVVRNSEAWWRWAAQQAQAGEYREALRGLLQAMLLWWDKMGLLPFQPARTNWEILPLLPSRPLREGFREWILFFERKYYGLQPCSAGEYRWAWERARLLAEMQVRALVEAEGGPSHGA